MVYINMISHLIYILVYIYMHNISCYACWFNINFWTYKLGTLVLGPFYNLGNNLVLVVGLRMVFS